MIRRLTIIIYLLLAFVGLARAQNDCISVDGDATINEAMIDMEYLCEVATSITTVNPFSLSAGANVLLKAPHVTIGTSLQVESGALLRVVTDFDPPSAPTNITNSAINPDELVLSWQAATDNVGVVAYRIRRDGVVIGEVSTTVFHDTGLAASTLYQYEVAATDSAGNVSEYTPLAVNTPASPPTGLLRGPYLQSASSDRITLRWRTDKTTASRVYYGTAEDQLLYVAQSAASATEHTVTLTGLPPDRKYYYKVQLDSGMVGSSLTRFATAPPIGSEPSTRIWVIGDSGTANDNARAVRDAYKAFNKGKDTNLWLMLGDNAYNSGTDEQYQAAVFDTYPELLQNTVLWSALGNHDGGSADSATQTGPYYDIFHFPTSAESGGLASGTEAYYSFDYGNIHFISLDSFDTDRSVGAAMHQWLEADLAANMLPWTIAFWHHPPYTKGSHNSDTEQPLIEMRERFVSLLEDYGVDLILSGHSHSYERSYLIDGHYGDSSTFSHGLHTKDGGDGQLIGSGIYLKANAAHQGTVFAVAGSSGRVGIGNGSLDHPAMYSSLLSLGSMVIDIQGDQLHAAFLDDAGGMPDSFSLIKNPAHTSPTVHSITFNAVADVAVGSMGSQHNGMAVFADGEDAGQELRGLFRWDLGTLPANAAVLAAEFGFDVSNASTGAYQVHAATTAWTEATADWANADSRGQLLSGWRPESLGSNSMRANGSGVATIQDWIDNNSNEGIVLSSRNSTDGVDISSRESGSAAILTIYYSLPTP